MLTYCEDGERKKVTRGPHELGPKVHHGPGLKSLADAQKAWDKIYWTVFQEHHSPAVITSKHKSTPSTNVKEFITTEFEARREWQENSKINWVYYRDSFIVPFFGEMSIAGMNDEILIRKFMKEIADRGFSNWTAKKAFTYVKAILDTAANQGLFFGNACRLIPKNSRIPQGMVTKQGQPHVSLKMFVHLLGVITRPRDRIILKTWYLCAVRRSELLVLKWMDFESSDVSSFTIQRSFDSRTHKVKEWNPALKAHGKVAVPPNLVCELEGWKKFGDTEDRPDGYIFPTRNGTCLIPTNWAEDVLKPAGEKVGIPDVSYHWFRRGHATVQHHDGHEGDKSIQGQLRHASPELTRKIYMQQIDEETWQSVVNLERLVNEHGLDKKGA